MVNKAADHCGIGHEIDQALERRDYANVGLFRVVAEKYSECVEFDRSPFPSSKHDIYCMVEDNLGAPILVIFLDWSVKLLRLHLQREHLSQRERGYE